MRAWSKLFYSGHFFYAFNDKIVISLLLLLYCYSFISQDTVSKKIMTQTKLSLFVEKQKISLEKMVSILNS